MGGIMHVSPGPCDRQHGMDTIQTRAATGDRTVTAAGEKNPGKSDKQWCVEWPWADIWKRLFWGGLTAGMWRGGGKVVQEFRIWTGAPTCVCLQGPVSTTNHRTSRSQKSPLTERFRHGGNKKKSQLCEILAELASLTLRSWIYRQRDVPNGSVICSAWLF